MSDKVPAIKVSTPPTLKRTAAMLRQPGSFVGELSQLIDTSTRKPELMAPLPRRPSRQPRVIDFSQQQRVYNDAEYIKSFEKDTVKKLKTSLPSNVRVTMAPVKSPRDKAVVSPKTHSQPVIESSSNNISIKSQSEKFFDTGIAVAELFDPLWGKEAELNQAYCVGKKTSINGLDIALFLYNKQVYAFENSCCHQNAALNEGHMMDIEEMGGSKSVCLVCPRHKWKFDAVSGVCSHDRKLKQNVYKTRIHARRGTIEIGFEDFSQSIFDDFHD